MAASGVGSQGRFPGGQWEHEPSGRWGVSVERGEVRALAHPTSPLIRLWLRAAATGAAGALVHRRCRLPC